MPPLCPRSTQSNRAYCAHECLERRPQIEDNIQILMQHNVLPSEYMLYELAQFDSHSARVEYFPLNPSITPIPLNPVSISTSLSLPTFAPAASFTESPTLPSSSLFTSSLVDTQAMDFNQITTQTDTESPSITPWNESKDPHQASLLVIIIVPIAVTVVLLGMTIIAIRLAGRKSSGGVSNRGVTPDDENSSIFGGPERRTPSESLQNHPSTQHNNPEVAPNGRTLLEVGSRISEERKTRPLHKARDATGITAEVISPTISHPEIETLATTNAEDALSYTRPPGRMRIKSFYYTFPPRSPLASATRTSSLLMTDLDTPFEDDVTTLKSTPMTKTESQRGRDMNALQTALGFPEVQIASPNVYSQP